jgi:hypothetical protein
MLASGSHVTTILSHLLVWMHRYLCLPPIFHSYRSCCHTCLGLKHIQDPTNAISVKLWQNSCLDIASIGMDIFTLSAISKTINCWRALLIFFGGCYDEKLYKRVFFLYFSAEIFQSSLDSFSFSILLIILKRLHKGKIYFMNQSIWVGKQPMLSPWKVSWEMVRDNQPDPSSTYSQNYDKSLIQNLV